MLPVPPSIVGSTNSPELEISLTSDRPMASGVSVGVNGTGRFPAPPRCRRKCSRTRRSRSSEPSDRVNVSPSTIPPGGTWMVSGSGSCMASVWGNCSVTAGAVPGGAASSVTTLPGLSVNSRPAASADLHPVAAQQLGLSPNNARSGWRQHLHQRPSHAQRAVRFPDRDRRRRARRQRQAVVLVELERCCIRPDESVTVKYSPSSMPPSATEPPPERDRQHKAASNS